MIADLPVISVQPGQLYLARTPVILRTILGSCVGVTFWSARFRAGALCHGILPRVPLNTSGPEGHRYVDFSIRYLAGQFDAMGVAREELDVKVFGGADVLPVTSVIPDRPTIGAMNCRTAMEVLVELDLRVAASDLGGLRGRTLRFHTGTGEVLLQRLARLPGTSRLDGDSEAAQATPRKKNRVFL